VELPVRFERERLLLQPIEFGLIVPAHDIADRPTASASSVSARTDDTDPIVSDSNQARSVCLRPGRPVVMTAATVDRSVAGHSPGDADADRQNDESDDALRPFPADPERRGQARSRFQTACWPAEGKWAPRRQARWLARRVDTGVAPRSSAAAAGFFLNSASIFQICDTAMGMAASRHGGVRQKRRHDLIPPSSPSARSHQDSRAR
jgi:hypothetical protein